MNNGRAVSLSAAFRGADLRGGVRPGFSVYIGDAPGDGFGLAGTPGRWRDFYGDRSPADFGHDEDKAVMYWEPGNGMPRGAAVPAEALIRPDPGN